MDIGAQAGAKPLMEIGPANTSKAGEETTACLGFGMSKKDKSGGPQLPCE